MLTAAECPRLAASAIRPAVASRAPTRSRRTGSVRLPMAESTTSRPMPPAATVWTSDRGASVRAAKYSPHPLTPRQNPTSQRPLAKSAPSDASGLRSDSLRVRATAPCWIRKPASRASAERERQAEAACECGGHARRQGADGNVT